MSEDHRNEDENYHYEDEGRRDEEEDYRHEDGSRCGEDEDSTITQMSTSTVEPADAPTFILECTTAHFVGSPLVGVDKPCLYFGFRLLGKNHLKTINVNSLVDKPMYIKCRIHPPNSQVFKLLNTEEEKLEALSTNSIYISFQPERSKRARATLHVSCRLGSDNPVEYKCRLLGFGGQAIVVPVRRGLVKSANGRYQLVPDAVEEFSFCLENRGERDAFAAIIGRAFDEEGWEIPAENLIIQPSNVLLPKNSASQKRIDVRMTDNASGSSFPIAFRIIVLWGEERQRQRLKIIHLRLDKGRGGRGRFSFIRRHFTIVKYSGEQPTWDNAPNDELLSTKDYDIFQSRLRHMMIDVLDSRAGARPTSAVPTMLEIEPDNTFEIDESAAGSTLDSGI